MDGGGLEEQGGSVASSGRGTVSSGRGTANSADLATINTSAPSTKEMSVASSPPLDPALELDQDIVYEEREEFTKVTKKQRKKKERSRPTGSAFSEENRSRGNVGMVG